jgi:hypothetical protein
VGESADTLLVADECGHGSFLWLERSMDSSPCHASPRRAGRARQGARTGCAGDASARRQPSSSPRRSAACRSAPHLRQLDVVGHGSAGNTWVVPSDGRIGKAEHFIAD